MKEEMYGHIHYIEQYHWWYVARRQIIFDWVLRIAENLAVPRILDIGCGTGFNLDHLQKHNYCHTVGLDLSPQALSFCRSRNLPNLICADGTFPPIQHASFDIIMALDLIEHLENDLQALRELNLLLKPGGRLIIFTPAFNFLWGLQDDVSHHYRRYTARSLRQKLERAGFIINKLSYVNTFLFPLILAGRTVLRIFGNNIQGTSENDLHPVWSNKILEKIFLAERPILRHMNMPFGVSLLCVAHKPD